MIYSLPVYVIYIFALHEFFVMQAGIATNTIERFNSDLNIIWLEFYQI